MKKKHFHVMFSKDYNIGNLSEEILYALFKAKRENSKVVFVRKYILFRSFMFNVLRLKQPKAIYDIHSEFIQHKNNTLFANLLALYGGLYIFVSYVYEALRYKSEKKLKQAFGLDVSKCKYDPSVPSFGVENLFNLHAQKEFSFSEEDKAYWRETLTSTFEIGFDEKTNALCKKSFTALGLDQYPWYVCLHIRTPLFHNAVSDAFRNSNIENYYDAIRYIISLGGAVVRMGDPMPNVEHIEGLVNYPNDPEKSEEMDLYLIKNCKFFIGTTSGIHDTALLFGVPVLSVNTNDYIFVKPYKECDSYIYKHIFSKEKNRILTFKEVLDEPFFVQSNVAVTLDMEKLHNNYEFIENSAEEILTAVQNIIYGLENHVYHRNEAQINFKNHLHTSVLKWIVTDEWFKQDIEQTYRVFSKEFYTGSIDKDFAEKYYGE
jgi:putative glycosyltransferase (TIGR04372 family)